MVTDAVLLSVGVIVLLGVRSIYGPLSHGSLERDAYAHLLFSREIREAGHRLPERPAKVATKGTYSYPYLMHWLLSFVPTRYLQTLDRYFSGVMDALLFGLILLLIPFGFLSVKQSFVCLVILVATPQFMRPDLSHGLGVSARKPGLLLTTASVLSFLLWVNTGAVALLVGSVVAGATVFLTSKFSVQAYLFILIGLQAGTANTAILLFVAALVLAVALSGLTYLHILESHVRFLYDYAVSKQFKISYTKPGIVPDVSDVESLRDVAEILYRNTLVRALGNNVFVVAVFASYLYSTVVEQPVPVPQGFGEWLVAGVAAFVLTSLPYLRFLGQAERYLEYVFVPSAVYLSHAWTAFGAGHHLIIGTTIVFGFASIPAFGWAYRDVFSNSEKSRDFQNVVAFLASKQPDTVLLQPLWRGRELAWKTDHRVVDFVLNGGSTTESTAEIDRLCPSEYGFITDDTDWLEASYEPDWVVFEKGRSDELPDGSLTPPRTSPAHETTWFEVYTFDAVRGG